ncbi:MAG: zinc ABC transporter substrate-binding protein [Candidatus Hydrogenedentes bacterium]|nr:zinc ABC transporter substrate-binding protein [Candidatus Hydrogenedentota bacterium]
MKHTAAITFLIAVLCLGCRPPSEQRVAYITTINPLRAIVAELVGDRGEVSELLAPGASPHTYEPRPSDAMAAESALAVFYAAEDIDAWAAKLPAKTRIEMFSLVPASDRIEYDADGEHDDHDEDGHHHETGYNGHFWSDPRIVSAIIPNLVEKLIELDPAGADTYRNNASRFSAELNELDSEMKSAFAGLENRPVFMFHPSWSYFMRRYGLTVGGMVEPFPGKEPTPKYIDELVDAARAKGVRAVFTEPQLPRRPAEVIAEACQLSLFELDPNGGGEGRRTYRELITYNADMLKKALQ